MIQQHATFLHGFTQTGSSWDSLVRLLPSSVTASCPDAPGHGLNPDGKRTLSEYASDIASTMQPGVLVGYSMGARMALHVATLFPHVVSQLVLISGTPGIRNEAERLARRNSDNSLADHIEDVGVESFINEWLALPLFSGLDSSNDQRSDRLRNSASGLANSLRYAGTGTQDPLWESLSQLAMPVHVIAGELDSKFVEIAREMNDVIPQSEISIVSSVGHSVHLEDELTTAAILQQLLR